MRKNCQCHKTSSSLSYGFLFVQFYFRNIQSTNIFVGLKFRIFPYLLCPTANGEEHKQYYSCFSFHIFLVEKIIVLVFYVVTISLERILVVFVSCRWDYGNCVIPRKDYCQQSLLPLFLEQMRLYLFRSLPFPLASCL